MARCCRYRAFSIAPGLNVMLIRINQMLPRTCWSALICFWRDIFEPYIPPYMSFLFGIVERHSDHIVRRKGLSVVGNFLFSYLLS